MYHTQRRPGIGSMNHASSLSCLACTYAAVIALLLSSAAGASKPLATARLVAEDRFAAWASDEEMFMVEVAASGYLLVDVSAFEVTENDFFVDLVGTTETVTVLKRTASAWLVAVRQPGTLSLRVDSIDSRRKPGAFDVRTGFLEDPVLRDWERTPRASADVLEQLCADDMPAGDSLLCAERLVAEERVTVDLHATVRSFSLRHWETVDISTLGELDTVGALYDDNGLRVATDDDSGAEGNFRIVHTLPPGRYFLRLSERRGKSGEALLQLNREEQCSGPEFETKDAEEDQDLVESDPD